MIQLNWVGCIQFISLISNSSLTVAWFLLHMRKSFFVNTLNIEARGCAYYNYLLGAISLFPASPNGDSVFILVVQIEVPPTFSMATEAFNSVVVIYASHS